MEVLIGVDFNTLRNQVRKGEGWMEGYDVLRGRRGLCNLYPYYLFLYPL